MVAVGMVRYGWLVIVVSCFQLLEDDDGELCSTDQGGCRAPRPRSPRPGKPAETVLTEGESVVVRHHAHAARKDAARTAQSPSCAMFANRE